MQHFYLKIGPKREILQFNNYSFQFRFIDMDFTQMHCAVPGDCSYVFHSIQSFNFSKIEGQCGFYNESPSCLYNFCHFFRYFSIERRKFFTFITYVTSCFYLHLMVCSQRLSKSRKLQINFSIILFFQYCISFHLLGLAITSLLYMHTTQYILMQFQLEATRPPDSQTTLIYLYTTLAVIMY